MYISMLTPLRSTQFKILEPRLIKVHIKTSKVINKNIEIITEQVI